ncbi:MAG TPA: hypothetical protein ENO03_02140 [Candidatus Aminicenantes bacterium]|nr:hypothetical protein [Candidatus Aminicenantes bacterium]
MKVIKSYAKGIKGAAAEGKMLLLLWLFNVLFASVIYVQFSGYLRDVFGASGAAANFLKSLDFNIIIEMLTFEGAGLSAIASLAMFLALVYGIFSLFISGGILHTLFKRRGGGRGNTENTRIRLAPVFFQGGGKFFGRFIRLFLWSLALWAGAAIVMMVPVMALGAVSRNGTNESLMFNLGLATAAFGLFLIFLIMMIVDYARIRLVVEDSRGALKSLLRSVGFIFRRFGKTLALYYLFLLTGAAVIALYCVISSGIKTYSIVPILIAFLFGQIFIFARGWLKVGLQAGQLDFFLSAAPPAPASEPAPVSEPVTGETAVPPSGPVGGSSPAEPGAPSKSSPKA